MANSVCVLVLGTVFACTLVSSEVTKLADIENAPPVSGEPNILPLLQSDSKLSISSFQTKEQQNESSGQKVSDVSQNVQDVHVGNDQSDFVADPQKERETMDDLFGYCNPETAVDTPKPASEQCRDEVQEIIAAMKQVDDLRQKATSEFSLSSVQDLLCLTSTHWQKFSQCFCSCNPRWTSFNGDQLKLWEDANCSVAQAIKQARASQSKSEASGPVQLGMNLCVWLKHQNDLNVDWNAIRQTILDMTTILSHSNTEKLTINHLELLLDKFESVVHAMNLASLAVADFKRKEDSWELKTVESEFVRDVRMWESDLSMRADLEEQLARSVPEQPKQVLETKLDSEKKYAQALDSIQMIENGMTTTLHKLKDAFGGVENYFESENVDASKLLDPRVKDLKEVDDSTLFNIEQAVKNLQKIHSKTLALGKTVNLSDPDPRTERSRYEVMNQHVNLKESENIEAARKKLDQLEKHCQLLVAEMNDCLEKLQARASLMLSGSTDNYSALLKETHEMLHGHSLENDTAHATSANVPHVTSEVLRDIDVGAFFQSAWNRARAQVTSWNSMQNKDNQSRELSGESTNKTLEKPEERKNETQSELGGILETSVPDDDSAGQKDNLFNHPLFYIWSFVIISFITMLSFFASFLVYKNK